METDKPAETQNFQQQPQTTEMHNPEEKPKNTKRKVIIVFGLLLAIALIIAVITGAYWYGKNSTSNKKITSAQRETASPTPDPTADWQVYNDSNYSFKYPSSFKIEDREWGPYLTLKNISFSVNADGGITLTPPPTITESSTLGGQTSQKNIYKNTDLSIYQLYEQTNFNDVNYVVGYGVINNATTSISSSDLEILNQILSSFKFTGSDTAVDKAADWEIYSGNDFSIKYPTGWRLVEDDNFVGFGPAEVGEDVAWTINTYDKSTKSVAEIIDDTGDQFTERSKKKETIIVNGLEATVATTTTKEVQEWTSILIIFENENKLYVVSNGAKTDGNLNADILRRSGNKTNISFMNFYSNFNFTN